jgi:hypothetical protein
MSKWQPEESAPKDGTSVLLWARLWASPLEPNSFFEVVGYFHRASGVERWKTKETDEDLKATHWAPLPLPPAREG